MLTSHIILTPTNQVSSKYLALTKSKLEVTRLPRHYDSPTTLPTEDDWSLGTPKSIVEPLIDYWLEYYNWRDIEASYNLLPQFRIALKPDQHNEGEKPIRIHFIHQRSLREDAIPLLLLPSFPFTPLSLEPLLTALSDPKDGGQVFHVVCPSLPGLGFSDAFTVMPAQASVLKTTATMFSSLMGKLGYEGYIVSSTGSGVLSPAGIDYHLARIIAETDRSCLGAHLIDTIIPAPTMARTPGSYLKYSTAKFFHASWFGYTKDDWAAATRSSSSPPATTEPKIKSRANTTDLESGTAFPTHQRKPRVLTTASWKFNSPSPSSSTSHPSSLAPLVTPHSHLSLPTTLTLAYGLCDSPTGLLSLILFGLQKLAPGHGLKDAEILTIVQLAWLPGPEGALRFWSGAHTEAKTQSVGRRKAKVVVTSYSEEQGFGAPSGKGSWFSPVWAETRHTVLKTLRREGRRGLPWERVEDVLDGVRALSGAVWPKPANEAPRLTSSKPIAEHGETHDQIMELEEGVVHRSSTSPSPHQPASRSLTAEDQATWAKPGSAGQNSSRNSAYSRCDSSTSRLNGRGEEIIDEVSEPETPEQRIDRLGDKYGERLGDRLEVPKRPGLEGEINSSDTSIGTLSHDSLKKP